MLSKNKPNLRWSSESEVYASLSVVTGLILYYLFSLKNWLLRSSRAPRAAKTNSCYSYDQWQCTVPTPSALFSPSFLLKANIYLLCLPRIYAVLNVSNPGVLLKRVDGLQDILAAVFHLWHSTKAWCF